MSPVGFWSYGALIILMAGLALPWLLRSFGILGRGVRWFSHNAGKRTGFDRRFPRVAAFLRARTDPTRASGLSLTLLLGGAFYSFFLFAGLIEDAYETDALTSVDSYLFSVVEALRTPEVIAVFKSITRFGNTETMVAVIAVATAFLAIHGPRSFVLPLWIAVAGSQFTTWIGKFAINRPRPDFILDVVAVSPSFPSAHAASSTAIYGIIAYIITRDLPYFARVQTAYWTLIFVGLIGLSRVVLNVHFPSDVAAGHLVGVAWLLLGVALGELRRA